MNRTYTLMLVVVSLILASQSQAQIVCEPQKQKLTLPEALAGDLFGGFAAIAIDGDVAVVGAFHRDDACPSDPECQSGLAYVYRRSGLNWDQEARLEPSDPTDHKQFGYSVSISGDVILIGASGDDWACPTDRRCDSGSAYVFRYDGNTWNEEARLEASDGAKGDQFGLSVSVDADTAVITAVADDDVALSSGSAYVFTRYKNAYPCHEHSDCEAHSPTTCMDNVCEGIIWVEEAKLTASDAAFKDLFGYFASISGDTVVVGAQWDDDGCGSAPNCNAGSAYVFVQPAGGWTPHMTETAKLTASNPSGGDTDYFGDRFGARVAIDGDTIMIAAPSHDNHPHDAVDQGAVYVFNRPMGGWVSTTEDVMLTAPDAAEYDYFGSTVSIRGDLAVFGAPGDTEGGTLSGSAYVFRRYEDSYPCQEHSDCAAIGLTTCTNNVCEGVAWVMVEPKLTASDAEPGDQFGVSAVISGNTVMIGATWDDDACPSNSLCDSGSVYVFDIADCNDNEVDDACDLDCGAPGGGCDVPGCGLGHDCNSNDIPDACDVACGVSEDCQANGIPDECDIEMPGGDCQPDGIVDACQLSEPIALASGDLGPISAESPRSFDAGRVPPARGDVVLEFRAIGDFNAPVEHVTVDINDAEQGQVFIVTGVEECPDEPSIEQLIVPAADFHAALAGRSLVIGMTASTRVSGTSCDDPGFIEVSVVYEGLVHDCNLNNVPDVCDISSGFSSDFNDDGVPDDCTDCNQNQNPDACDLDCEAPGCGLPDCGISGDCNDNGIPDECDIGAGQGGFCEAAVCSSDCQSDGTPDECQLTGTALEPIESRWIADAGNWNCGPPGSLECGPNWCPDVVPDNTPDAIFNVSIGRASALVTLDRSPSIRALLVDDGAIVEMNAESGADARSLLVSTVIDNDGTFRATDRERLVLDSPVINQGGVCGEGGVLEATDGTEGPGEENDKSILEINGALVLGGTARTSGDNSEIHLIGGAELIDVCVDGVVVPDGQTGRFSGTITNTDVLRVAGETSTTRLEPGALNPTLVGSGSIRLMNQSFSQLGHFNGTFANSSTHRVEGAGIVFGGMANEGTVEANDSHGEQLVIFPPGEKTNSGSLRATGAGVLRIEDDISQSSTGRIEAVDCGLIELNADVTGTGTFHVHGRNVAARGGCTTPPMLRVAQQVSILGADLEVLDGGIVEVAGDATLELTGAVTIGDGGTYRGAQAGAPSSASLTAGSISFFGSANLDPEPSAQMLLTDTMALAVTGDVSVCRLGSVSARGGCTPPPKLHVLNAATVDILGSLLLGWEVDMRVTQGTTFTLSGDFDNQSIMPDLLDWTGGSLTLSGIAQAFEVAGQDRGADPSGFVDNFAMGTLELLSSTTVDVIDAFNNQQDGQAVCDEALYVDTLILHPGAVLNNNTGCKVYFNSLVNDGGVIPNLGVDVIRIPVDLDDYRDFHECLLGPELDPAQPITLEARCDRFFADEDPDVDLADFSDFQRAFTGGHP